MLEVSSSKPLANESKGFAFWVELVVPSLPSAGYLSYVVCELLHRSGGFYPVRTQMVAAAGSSCHQKKIADFLNIFVAQTSYKPPQSDKC